MKGPSLSFVFVLATLLATLVATLASCATVRPQDRGALADPTMRFDEGPHGAAARHVLENREGSAGGAAARGGGCGCN